MRTKKRQIIIRGEEKIKLCVFFSVRHVDNFCQKNIYRYMLDLKAIFVVVVVVTKFKEYMGGKRLKIFCHVCVFGGGGGGGSVSSQ